MKLFRGLINTRCGLTYYRKPLLILLSVFIIAVFLCGCTTPNMTISSRQYIRHWPAGKKLIIVEEPDNPTELEAGLLTALKQSLARNGFLLVDNVDQARRVLSFTFQDKHERANMTFAKDPSLARGGKPFSYVTTTLDTVSSVTLSLQDITSIKAGSSGMIWQSTIITEPRFFKECPDQVFDQALKAYKKPNDRTFHFKARKPRQR